LVQFFPTLYLVQFFLDTLNNAKYKAQFYEE